MEIKMGSPQNKNLVTLTCFAPLMTPIIKIVGNYCNLRCDYCFYHDKDQQSRAVMSKDILNMFLKEHLDLFNGNIRFNWHGGEPLLAGLPFFEDIMRLQRMYIKDNQKITNSIQTNGTLVNEEWALFFKANNFEIGISLDGIKECHDRFRRNEKGESSFDLTIQAIKILQSYSIPVGILQTITHSNIHFTKENFSFFVNDLNLKQICTCIYNPIRESQIPDEIVTNEDFIYYLKVAIDFWLNQNDPDLEFREIESIFAGLNKKIASVCGFNGTCSGFFCVERCGNIYPCDRVSNKEEFCFGNLSKQSLKDILNGQKRLEWAKKTNFLHKDCMRCYLRNACRNGCTDYRKSDGKYYFCEARKFIFDYFENKIHRR